MRPPSLDMTVDTRLPLDRMRYWNDFFTPAATCIRLDPATGTRHYAPTDAASLFAREEGRRLVLDELLSGYVGAEDRATGAPLYYATLRWPNEAPRRVTVNLRDMRWRDGITPWSDFAALLEAVFWLKRRDAWDAAFALVWCAHDQDWMTIASMGALLREPERRPVDDLDTRSLAQREREVGIARFRRQLALREAMTDLLRQVAAAGAGRAA